MLEKPRPRALEKADQRREQERLSRIEDQKVKARSGGVCEVWWADYCDARQWHHGNEIGCTSKAAEIHHLKGGIGRRNRGDSMKAEWKLHVCGRCHDEITRHILVPVDPQADATRIVYERRR